MRAPATLAAALTLLVATTATAEPLVADLSSHRITIDSGFTGSDVLLYGAVDIAGDMVIVVRGPEERIVVRRKDRVAGLWMNRAEMTFDRVPGYYAVAASRPLGKIASTAFLGLYQIGLDHLRLEPVTEAAEPLAVPFRDAIVRNRVRNGLYRDRIGTVSFLGARLFRTTVRFPANAPTGSYKAEIYLIRDGQVVSAETTPLFISKTGFQAEINYYALNRPAAYGLVAIAIALIAGWLAAILFRRT